MAELTNPLFEDEKEFLERQKLEYERALMGDVEEIKEKTQQASKYVAIGAGVLAGAWLLSKAFGGKKDKVLQGRHQAPQTLPSARAPRTLRKHRATVPDPSTADDLGFGNGHHADRGQQPSHHERAQIAPDVYHASALASSDTLGSDDPFQPIGADVQAYAPVRQAARPHSAEPDPVASSIVADTFRVFLQSDTGKMLVAQATAVLMAVVAKKLNEYLPMLKNPDLATSPAEPETRDIDFTYHHDDANAPHKPL
ncbi:hypothetical protein [Hymenobacter sp. APR13]|uniref:hypothetical protein n=1 Tax=Hymenobacter sp. APR13 TaxID=1356852 RepID=UPI0004E084E6|nr:hypothetical protein [Hymenobacter sp. APR13]AII51911.1 hypothetical protein N008_07960 [Hymenobacter sp. APR13]